MTEEILEALPYPVYLVDEAGLVRRMNGRAERLSAALQIPGELPVAVRKVVEDAVLAGRDLVGDDLRRAVEIGPPGADPRGAASYVPQIKRIAPAAGAEATWLVVLTDVTPLRQHDAAKTKAMSTLGHEVKTPVTSIRMVLHLLLEEKVGPLTADQRELVAAGQEDCERLLTILQGLLELGRLEGGRVALKLKPVAVEELLAAAGLRIEALSAALPKVMAEAGSVARILKNFGAVILAAGEADTVARARVERRGEGRIRFLVHRRIRRALSETECVRMFEAFAIKAENDPEKSGLSLAIARELAGLHGGSVGVASDEKEMEFYLELPVAPEAPSPDVDPSEA